MTEPMLPYSDFVRLVLAALNAAEIPYMIGGAVAAWAWGEPRATRDLDIVVQVHIEAVNRLSEELTARDMLVPADIILNCLLDDRADIPLNAIHIHSGYKADIYLLREGDALREEAFRRRKLVDLGPEIGNVFLHTPEDLIIYKLWYYSLSKQTKHLRDITAIANTLGNDLDQEYIRRWAEEKEVISLWNELLARIKSEK
ncbi:MAG: hypothetical protein H8D37_03225 [Chloroflexi bacterium]|nr:hypothetical protein [Chloroflexota bacterium]